MSGKADLAALESAVSDAVDSIDVSTPAPEPSPAPAPESPSGEPEAAAPPESASPAPTPEGDEPVAGEPGEEEGPIFGEPANKFLAKFNGDVNKAAEHYWEINNRNSDLARENKALNDRLKSVTPAEAPRPEAPLATETLPQGIPSAEDITESLTQIRGELAKTANLNQRINYHLNPEAEGSTAQRYVLANQAFEYWGNVLSNPTPDTDLDKARAEFNAAVRVKNELSPQITALRNRKEAVADRYDELLRQEKSEVRVQGIVRDLQVEAGRREEQAQSAFAGNVRNTIQTVARQSKISKTDYPAFFEYAKRSMMAHLAENMYDNPGYRIEDPDAMVRSLAQEWTGSHIRTARAQLATYTRAKIADTRRAPTPARGRTPALPPGQLGAEQQTRPKSGRELLAELEERTDAAVDQAHREAYGA